eukprot:scaffold548812_cov17-Prasinocladus_malaysianus.AAC.1
MQQSQKQQHCIDGVCRAHSHHTRLPPHIAATEETRKVNLADQRTRATIVAEEIRIGALNHSIQSWIPMETTNQISRSA